uniref:Cytokine receptor CRFB2 n=1 Tax=Tetraodon nigroviridis TaxID=99883 RepID=Q7ZT26_TETNG|nr:class II helical cytokine receptor CRFB2 [Tetraodon nigroviridis]CAD79444.1 cytokine receptor CRFB2 [Tetraodon nigroviridis]
MVTLLRTLVWLPLALTAPTQLPAPDALTLTSTEFVHVIRWEPGPGMPPNARYSVTYKKEREQQWEPVPGCQRVQDLACELTQTLSKENQVYIIQVTALLEDQDLGRAQRKFNPFRDTHLGLPVLVLLACGRDLCVDLQPPQEDLRDTYQTLRYRLKIQTSAGERTQAFRSLETQVLEHLHPGREYCVSVCFHDTLFHRMSGYSRPVCGVAPGNRPAATDALTAGLLCPLLLVGVATVAWLAAAGYICLIRRPLPRVLASIPHVDSVLVLPASSLTSLLAVEVTAPPTGGQEELTEESSQEATAGSSGGKYMQWDGGELLSSSALHPSFTRVLLVRPCCQTPPLTPAPPPGSHQAPAACVSGGEAPEEEEEEEEDGGSSRDVNLFTLTFGMQPGEELASSSSSSSSEDVATETPAPTWTLCPAEEEEESGYMPRLP